MKPNKAKERLLTAERLRGILNYDPETGLFTWRERTGNCQIGDLAGSKHNRGYHLIVINGQKYLSHRLAWLYMTGKWPEDQIDHINGGKVDNRWRNLREAGYRINAENRRVAQKNNISGIMGVSYRKDCPQRPWRARIKVAKNPINIGHFATPQEAHKVYLQAKRQLHQGCTL